MAPDTPEQRARRTIDALLYAAGWIIQSLHEVNLGTSLGVAVREVQLRVPSGRGFADYVLFVAGKAIGVVEAKPEGVPLGGISHQSAKYSGGLPPHFPSWRTPLPFLYASTSQETQFTNALDPDPRRLYNHNPNVAYSSHRCCRTCNIGVGTYHWAWLPCLGPPV